MLEDKNKLVAEMNQMNDIIEGLRAQLACSSGSTPTRRRGARPTPRARPALTTTAPPRRPAGTGGPARVPARAAHAVQAHATEANGVCHGGGGAPC